MEEKEVEGRAAEGKEVEGRAAEGREEDLEDRSTHFQIRTVEACTAPVDQHRCLAKFLPFHKAAFQFLLPP